MSQSGPQTVLITGAASGIGRALAEEWHARGARLVLVDRDAAGLQSLASMIDGISYQADVSDAGEMRDVVNTAANRLGGLDTVVANAGVSGAPATTLGTPPEAFFRTVSVNLHGAVNTVQPALPHLVRARGQILLVSSVYAFVNGMLGAPYAISKAGLEAFGRALSVELSIHAVTVTIGYLGVVDTPLVSQHDLDPRMLALQARLPGVLRRRLPPHTAAQLLVDGVIQRRARVIAPSIWKLPFYARGVLGPAGDHLLARRSAVRSAVKMFE